MIETIGQLKQAIADVEDNVRVGVEDADTCWILNITGTGLSNDLLTLTTDYKHRIDNAPNTQQVDIILQDDEVI